MLAGDGGEFGEGDLGVPRGGGAADAVGVGVGGEVGFVLGGPEVGGGLGLAAAALGVVDGGAFRAGPEPQGFAGGVADGLFDLGARGGEAEGLAVGGVAEVEGFGLVAVEVGEGEGADGDGEGAEGLRGFVGGGFAVEGGDDVALAGEG